MLELWEYIEYKWNAISSNIYINLIENIPRHINTMLKAWGEYVKYWINKLNIKFYMYILKPFYFITMYPIYL